MVKELPLGVFFLSIVIILVISIIYTKAYYPMLKYLEKNYPKDYRKRKEKFLYNANFMFDILFTRKLSFDKTLHKYQLIIRAVFALAFLYALGIIIYAAL